MRPTWLSAKEVSASSEDNSRQWQFSYIFTCVIIVISQTIFHHI